jgi:glycosyltransferase involved in cell wall biosynthesis
MGNLPRISIIMPSFNQARFIEESIQSILAQDYPYLEFMILDGGSSDGSQEIIEYHSDRLAYWHSRPDKGQPDALMQGFKRATGDLLGWMNSDDILLPRALQSIAQAYNLNPDCGLFGGNFVLIDRNSRIIRCKRYPAQAAKFARHGLCFVCQPGSFFKRQDYEAVGGLDPSLHYTMDADLYIHMLTNGTQYAYVNTWLSGFRMHALSKTVIETERMYQEYQMVQRRYWLNRRSNLAWRYYYRAWQVMNGNYFRMSIETLLAHNRHWQEWAGA